MNSYLALNSQIFTQGSYSIIPIRYEDRFDIMKWRNEQIYHLRQHKPLTEEDQENYFKTVVAALFNQEQPNQILFSFMEGGVCIGYGGLVHINWIDQNAEISFVMNTHLEKDYFAQHWSTFLALIEQVAFSELRFHKIFTYAYDLRTHLFEILEKAGFKDVVRLKGHYQFNGSFGDVLIHSKFHDQIGTIDKAHLSLREANFNDAQLLFNWANEKSVRQNSIDQQPIIWENHLKWFTSRLNNPAVKIFILMAEGKALGQIRIEFMDAFWVIDYSIQKEFRGKGLGKEIVKLLLAQNENYAYKAIVKKQNIASIKVFENLGFKPLQTENDTFCCFVC